MHIELAKRAVTCKHWRWMPGMLIAADGYVDRVCIAWEDEMLECRDIEIIGDQIAEVLPDLDDPATLGCLLALVREAWGAAPATVNCHSSYLPQKGHYRFWTCVYCTGQKWEEVQGESESEALVAALEAAP